VGRLEGTRILRIGRQRHDSFEYIRNVKIKGEIVVSALDQLGIDLGLRIESFDKVVRAGEFGFCETSKEVFELRGGIENVGQAMANERESLVQVVRRGLQLLHEHGYVIEASCKACRHGRRITREQEARFKRLKLEYMTCALLIHHSSASEARVKPRNAGSVGADLTILDARRH